MDAGGLRREYLGQLSKEVMGRLRLFERSVNGIENLGTERDKYVAESATIGDQELRNFFKVGLVLAQCLHKDDILNLNLPSIFWSILLSKKKRKLIFLDKEVRWKDYKCINHTLYTCLEQIRTMKDSELEYLDQNFVTYMNDGTELELKPGGRHIKLCPENKEEYISLVKEKTMAMVMLGFEEIKRGFYHYLFDFCIRFMDPLMIEEKVCGMNYVSFKKNNY